MPERNYFWLDSFLERLVGDVYEEPPSEPHLTLTRTIIEQLHRDGLIRAGQRVLDVGCGQGLALEHFARLGLPAIGVTLGPDYEVCRSKGLDVREMDQSFMDFEDGGFDLLWCRHILEHSIAPFFTLSEYARMLKPEGLAYIEVPAPDTPCHHETNPNHYSVLPRSSWLSLFERVGFQTLAQMEHSFETVPGTDTYWGFLLRKVR